MFQLKSFSSPKHHSVLTSLVSWASWSSPRMPVVFPCDLWLSIRTIPLLTFRTRDPLADWLPPIVLASSSESAFTRTSKRRLDVGYLDIDFVIPCNLAVGSTESTRDYAGFSNWKENYEQKYLRANASISACFCSLNDGSRMRFSLTRFGSLIKSTCFSRYASSSSVKFSALIWSLMTIRGSKNHSKSLLLGLLSDVISEPSPAYYTWKSRRSRKVTINLFSDEERHSYSLRTKPSELALADRRSALRITYAGKPTLSTPVLTLSAFVPSISFGVITPSATRSLPWCLHSMNKRSSN